MANQPQGEGRVKPSRPPPPPPSPKAQGHPPQQTRGTPLTQLYEELYENPEETQQPQGEGRVKPSRPPPPPPPPTPKAQGRPPQLIRGTPLTQLDEELYENPEETQFAPAEPLYVIPDEEPLYTEPYEPASPEQAETDSKQHQFDNLYERTAPKPTDFQPVHRSVKVLTRQNSVEELKQRPQEEPLYCELIEEPLYVDPDELNLPVFSRKPKPSLPPRPSSGSLHHSASEHSPSEQQHKPQARRFESVQVGGSHAQTSQRSSLHPQLSLPTHLPLAKGPHQVPGSTKGRVVGLV